MAARQDASPALAARRSVCLRWPENPKHPPAVLQVMRALSERWGARRREFPCPSNQPDRENLGTVPQTGPGIGTATLPQSRYPPPWDRSCFIVRNANEQALAEQRTRAAIKLLNRDEARRKAAVTDVAKRRDARAAQLLWH